MKKLVALVFCILCAGLIFAKGSSDSSSSSSSSSGSSSGGRPLTTEERELHKDAGGGKTDYDRITVVERFPTPEEVREAGKSAGSKVLDKYSDSDITNVTSNRGAISLPDDTIYTTDPGDTALTAHEIEHQSQYQNGDKQGVFEKLVEEALEYDSKKSNPYEDKETLEGKAQEVENKARDILRTRSMIW